MAERTSDKARSDARKRQPVSKASIVTPSIAVPIAHAAPPPKDRPVSSALSYTSSSLGPVDPLALPEPAIPIKSVTSSPREAAYASASTRNQSAAALGLGTRRIKITISSTPSTEKREANRKFHARVEDVPDPEAASSSFKAKRRAQASSTPVCTVQSLHAPHNAEDQLAPVPPPKPDTKPARIADPISRYDTGSPNIQEIPRPLRVSNPTEIKPDPDKPPYDGYKDFRLSQRASTYSTVASESTDDTLPSDLTSDDENDTQPSSGMRLIQAIRSRRQDKASSKPLEIKLATIREDENVPLGLLYRRAKTTGAAHGQSDRNDPMAHRAGPGTATYSEGQAIRTAREMAKRTSTRSPLLDSEFENVASLSSQVSSPATRPADPASPPQHSLLSSSHSLLYTPPSQFVQPQPAVDHNGPLPVFNQYLNPGRMISGPDGRCRGTYLACHNCPAGRLEDDWSLQAACYHCAQPSRAVSRWRATGELCNIEPKRPFTNAVCELCGFARPILGGKNEDRWFGLCFGCNRKVRLIHPRWFKDKKDRRWCCKTEYCRLDRSEADNLAPCPGCKLTPGVEQVGRHKQKKTVPEQTLSKVKAVLRSSAAKLRGLFEKDPKDD